MFILAKCGLILLSINTLEGHLLQRRLNEYVSKRINGYILTMNKFRLHIIRGRLLTISRVKFWSSLPIGIVGTSSIMVSDGA